jgi:5S rRNA maturation endonuclease (ribonuclease M5)
MTEEIEKEINKLKEKETLIIVEGIKDKKALEKFGLTKIITLSKKPLYQIIETVAEKSKETAILTDLDSKGKELYHKLFVGLQKYGIKIDNNLRELLFKAKISHIEGLGTFMEKKEKINYVST